MFLSPRTVQRTGSSVRGPGAKNQVLGQKIPPTSGTQEVTGAWDPGSGVEMECLVEMCEYQTCSFV